MKYFCCALVASAFIQVFSQASADNIPAERIEALAQQAIEELNLTGLSLAVVADEKVLFLNSYGLRDISKDIKVNENTLFPIGSIGKGFTTAALAMLADEGKLDWDDPVRNFIPEFEMSDPYISNEFSIRDLLTHRSGLPLGAGDLLFVPDGDADIPAILAAIKNIPPETSFRSEFAYDNLMYILAGEVISRVEERSWEDVIRSRIFKPLDMDDCRALPSAAARASNTVTQHARNPGSAQSIPLDPRYILSDSMAPAGGISCPINDLARWAQFWLNGGKTPEGNALISPEQMRELWTGVTPRRVSAQQTAMAGTHFSLYALGWGLNEFNGELLVSHGGAVLGAVAHLAILPEQNIAVFATANDFVPGLSGLTLQILSEHTAPESSANWIAAVSERYAAYLAAAAKDAGPEDEPIRASEPVRPMADYTGVYTDVWYGEATISIRDGGLYLDMGRSEVLDAPLIPVGDDKFLARWPDRNLNADAYVMFAVKGEQIDGMTMQAVSETTDFSYDFHDLNFKKNRQ